MNSASCYNVFEGLNWSPFLIFFVRNVGYTYHDSSNNLYLFDLWVMDKKFVTYAVNRLYFRWKDTISCIERVYMDFFLDGYLGPVFWLYPSFSEPKVQIP